MKKIASAIILIISTAFAATGQEQPLRGDEAVSELKESGRYYSLMDAVKGARRSNIQSEGPLPVNAVGEWFRAFSPDAGFGTDDFGNSVAVSGDIAVVGARQADPGGNTNQGAAYVFVRSGKTWVEQQTLTAPDGIANDQFGSSVAVSGTTIIVGSAFDDGGRGSAFVFVQTGSTWAVQQKLIASDRDASDFFGTSVAFAGDTAVIGASGDNAPAVDQGSAYVFVRAGVVWSEQQKLTAVDGQTNAFFGLAVAISGDTVAIGAPYNSSFPFNPGFAYIFIRTGTTWTQQQKLTANDGLADDRFGSSIAISGDTVLVGAPHDDVFGNTDPGSAYVFVRSGTVWTQQQQLIGEGFSFDRFGSAVAITGDTAVVGAVEKAIGGNPRQGAAYVFVRTGTTWTRRERFEAETGFFTGSFGKSIAISGSSIIVGGRSTAHIFRFLTNDWTEDAQAAADDGATADQFGYSVAISGDTAAVGSPYDDVGSNADQGSVYVFVHSPAGWILQQRVLSTPPTGAPNNYFGSSVALFGNSLVVGAPGEDTGGNIDQGVVRLYARFGTSWSYLSRLQAGDGAPGDKFGSSVGYIGSTVHWIVVGAPGDDVGENVDQGSAYFFTNESSSWMQRSKVTAADGAAGDRFGCSVSLHSNTAVIGAFTDDVGANVDQGSAYVFLRSIGTWSEQTKLIASDGAAGDKFGNSVSFDVALNGDTAIVGASQADGQQGAAYVFYRSGAWFEQQKLTALDGVPSDGFGSSVSISGETAVVGASLDDVGTNADQGSAYVFQRSGAAWTQIERVVSADGSAGDQLGHSVALSGDKLIAGAPFFNVSGSDTGAAVFFIDSIPTVQGTSARNLFDYDGDGKTDFSIFRPGPGEWWILGSSNNTNSVFQFGASSDKITPADFTGDGKTDVAIFRPPSGTWFIQRSEDFSFYSFPFGTTDDVPVPADYDGDGQVDAAVFRPGTSTWYIRRSSGGTDILGFGASGDRPVSGDYDGDGKADIAIFRPNGGGPAEWWVRRSTDGSVFALQFGIGTDRPTSGDFTGDGKADIVVWRPSNGVWYILRSEDFSYYAFEFGESTDFPAAGDYDGDGKWDAGVFRPSNGTWYAQRSTSGTVIRQYGIGGDIPTPSAFIP